MVTKADSSWAVWPTARVGYWRLNESSGTTAVNLGSGSGLNETYNSATLGTAGPRPPNFNGFEPNNNAPTFDGTSGYIAVNNSLLNNRSAFTIGGGGESLPPSLVAAGPSLEGHFVVG